METRTIRPATPDDARALLEVYAPYVLNSTITFEEEVPALSDYVKRVETITKLYPYLVYIEADRIAGYAYASQFRRRAADRWGAELSVYLKKEARERGAGIALYSCLLDLLRAQGFYKAYGVIAMPNAPSIALHRKFGFEDIAVIKNAGCKHGKWIDVLYMEKALANPTPNPEEPMPWYDLPDSELNRALSLGCAMLH